MALSSGVENRIASCLSERVIACQMNGGCEAVNDALSLSLGRTRITLMTGNGRASACTFYTRLACVGQVECPSWALHCHSADDFAV